MAVLLAFLSTNRKAPFRSYTILMITKNNSHKNKSLRRDMQIFIYPVDNKYICLMIFSFVDGSSFLFRILSG
ncbi:MAG: hypothetical protein LBT50_11805 [Prevotellaceae bacterium]|nr:hypothetical protein [Prevotellaceae bacterium]